MRNSAAPAMTEAAEHATSGATISRRRRFAPGFATLDDAPVILTIDEVASIYRCGVSTIRKQCATGEFRPAPFAMRPYRWRKTDIATDLAARSLRPSDHRRRRRRRKSSS